MSLREILHLTQQPIHSKIEFAAQTISLLVNMVVQLATICEEEDVDLENDVHAFDLKNNEWHIAVMQIYESLFRDEAPGRADRGEIRFDEHGNYIEPTTKGPNAIDVAPTMAAALRPLLVYIDGYRRRTAAPEGTQIRTKYVKYTDLNYIRDRLPEVENDVYMQYWREQNEHKRRGI